MEFINTKFKMWFLFFLNIILFFIQSIIMVILISMISNIFIYFLKTSLFLNVNFVWFQIKMNLEKDLILFFSLFIIFLAIFVICSFSSSKLLAFFLSKLSMNLREKCFHQIISENKTINKNQILNIVSSDIEQLENSLTVFIKSFVQGPSMIIVGLVSMSYLGIEYLLITLILVFCNSLLIMIIITFNYIYFKSERIVVDKMNKEIIDIFENIEVIKSFKLNKNIISKFNYVESKFKKIITKISLSSSFVLTTTFLIENILIIYVYFAFGKKENIASINSFSAYISIIAIGITMLLFSIFNISKSNNLWKRIKNISKKNEKNTIEFVKIKNFEKLELKDITFKYSEENLIQNFDFLIEKNKKYIFYGKTGSGKTTLIKIITTSIIPTFGKYIINNKEIKKIKNISKLFSICPQIPLISKDSMLENFKIYNENITYEEILNYLKIVKMDDKFPDIISIKKFNFIKSGNNLSGGQLKRINLAFCLSKKSDILILDDFMSGLDKENRDYFNDLIFSKIDTFKSIILFTSSKLMKNNNAIIKSFEKGKNHV